MNIRNVASPLIGPDYAVSSRNLIDFKLETNEVNAHRPSPRWISLNEAAAHVVLYCHSFVLAQSAIRDALIAGKIASLAAKFRAVPYHHVPGPLDMKRSIIPPVPVIRDNYEIGPTLWERLTIDWPNSAASQRQEMEPKEFGTYESSGKRFVARAIWHPAIDVSGIVLSESHVFELWPPLAADGVDQKRTDAPTRTERVGRRKGTGLYCNADTKTVLEVIGMIEGGEAVSCDGAVNEILRKDPSRLLGKSDDAMRRRIRDRYSAYKRRGTLQ